MSNIQNTQNSRNIPVCLEDSGCADIEEPKLLLYGDNLIVIGYPETHVCEDDLRPSEIEADRMTLQKFKEVCHIFGWDSNWYDRSGWYEAFYQNLDNHAGRCSVPDIIDWLRGLKLALPNDSYMSAENIDNFHYKFAVAYYGIKRRCHFVRTER